MLTSLKGFPYLVCTTAYILTLSTIHLHVCISNISVNYICLYLPYLSVMSYLSIHHVSPSISLHLSCLSIYHVYPSCLFIHPYLSIHHLSICHVSPSIISPSVLSIMPLHPSYLFIRHVSPSVMFVHLPYLFIHPSYLCICQISPSAISIYHGPSCTSPSQQYKLHGGKHMNYFVFFTIISPAHAIMTQS